MQTIPLRTALIDLAHEHERRAQCLEKRSFQDPSLAEKAQAERAEAQRARAVAEGLRF